MAGFGNSGRLVVGRIGSLICPMYAEHYVTEYCRIESSEMTPNTLLFRCLILLKMACVVYGEFNHSHNNKHWKNTSPPQSPPPSQQV